MRHEPTEEHDSFTRSQAKRKRAARRIPADLCQRFVYAGGVNAQLAAARSDALFFETSDDRNIAGGDVAVNGQVISRTAIVTVSAATAGGRNRKLCEIGDGLHRTAAFIEATLDIAARSVEEFAGGAASAHEFRVGFRDVYPGSKDLPLPCFGG